MLELAGVTVDRRLRDIHASWPRGQLIGLLGPNGSGKSTLLRALAGLLPYSGRILWEGQDLADCGSRLRATRLSYLPQEVSFGQPFTAEEVVLMGAFARLNRWGRAAEPERRRARECLARVGAGHLAGRCVTALSGGEVQRVRLAQALAQDAEAWLLDEPTSALDLHQQLECLDLFRELQHQGKSLLLVLHDLNLARQLCHQCWVLEAGQLKLQGRPEELFETPEFQTIFQVKMEIFQNQAGESVWWPRKLTARDGFASL